MQTVKLSALFFGFALVTVACGDSKSSLNPTAPSALSPGTLSVEANAADVEAGAMGNGPKPGNGNGNGGNGNGNRPPANAPSNPAPSANRAVQLEGLVDAVDTSSVTVNGQKVAVTAATVIRHGNRSVALGDLRRGDRVHVRANRVESATAPLEATEIKLQNPGDAIEEPAPDVVPPPAPLPEPEPDAVVSVQTVDGSASETSPTGSNPGSFLLTRTATDTQLANPLTVQFTLSGTAVNGVDYANVPLTTTFLAGQSTVDVTVTPIADGVSEPLETVVLTLSSGASYVAGLPASAQLSLTDEPLPVVTVAATDPNASEAPDRGRFVLTRTGSVMSPLTVTVVLAGAAENGVDYQLVVTPLTFSPGSSVLTVNLMPIPDLVEDPSETVVLELVDGDDYDLGAATVAVVTILGS